MHHPAETKFSDACMGEEDEADQAGDEQVPRPGVESRV